MPARDSGVKRQATLAPIPIPAITLEVLPAGYGDCLLISCPVGRRTWRLLVDTGPDECYPALKARLAQLPGDKHGRSRQAQAEAAAAAAAARPVRSEQGPVRIATKRLAIRVRAQ